MTIITKSMFNAMRLSSVFFFLISSVAAQASTLPPNRLGDQDHLYSTDASEEEFNAVIDEVVNEYGPIVKSYGATLLVNRDWKNSEVNASAEQVGKTWKVNMYGGLYRRPEMTNDGFAAVVCHELGHHLAGFAFKTRFGMPTWAATEGQSDYFATHVCMKRLWKNEFAKNAEAAKNVNSVVKDKCDLANKTKSDRNLCYRVASAGMPLAQLLAAVNNKDPKELDYAKRNPKIVSVTDQTHPEAQCRLDTYFEGALCTANFDPNVIPGRNHPKGQGSIEAEEVSAHYSCTEKSGYNIGLRPLCWYKPRM